MGLRVRRAGSGRSRETWITPNAGFDGRASIRAFFAFDTEQEEDETANGEAIDPDLALPRVLVSLNDDKAYSYWICAAVAAALFAEPMGFARWGLSTIAPLVWWQVAASTAAGTLMAAPYLVALTNPAVSYRLSFPALARVAFGVRGADLVLALRGVLGLALTALTALVGGAATYRLWGEVSYIFFDGAPLPSWAPAAAYALFWIAQLSFASVKSQAKKVRALGRLAVLTAGAYFAWSWNAGDAATVWSATTRAFQSAGGGGGFAGVSAAFAPAFEPEFWRHAAMVCGTWMTLGTLMPDYAQRMATPRSVAFGVTVALPAFSAAAALVGSSLAQAPNLALYGALLVACLVTNAATNLVGPVACVKAFAKGRLAQGEAALIVTTVAAFAAYAVLPWQTVVAYASWAVGAGALFVAPAAGVFAADYWVCRDGVVDRDALETREETGAYAYRNGVNVRAVVALFAGMAPDVWSFARNVARNVASKHSPGASPWIQVDSAAEAARSVLGSYVVNSEYSAVLAVATSFVVYVALTVLFTPESLKRARAEAAALAAEERPRRDGARLEAKETAANATAMNATARIAVSNASRRSSSFYGISDSVDEEDIVSREVTTEETEEEIVITTVTRQRRRRANEYIETGVRSTIRPSKVDVETVDLEAARRFYLDAAERIKRALAPARAAKRVKRAAMERARQEELTMLESHVAKRGTQTVAEVRYETMRVKERIAEAELSAAIVDDELAEAWVFFEDEAAEDAASLEARLLPQRDQRLRGPDAAAAREVYALIDERRARAADAAAAVPPAAAAQETAASEAKDASTASRVAAEALRSEDASLSQLRNWALAVDAWRAPPVMDVPMLPMSEAEAKLRSEEDRRRALHENSVRLEAEEETRVRLEEDQRRFSA